MVFDLEPTDKDGQSLIPINLGYRDDVNLAIRQNTSSSTENCDNFIASTFSVPLTGHKRFLDSCMELLLLVWSQYTMTCLDLEPLKY